MPLVLLLAVLLLAACACTAELPAQPPPAAPPPAAPPPAAPPPAAAAEVQLEGTVTSITVPGETWAAPALRLPDDTLVRITGAWASWDTVAPWKGRRVRWRGTRTATAATAAVGELVAELHPAADPEPLAMSPDAVRPATPSDPGIPGLQSAGLAWHGPVGARGVKTVRLSRGPRKLGLAAGGAHAVAELPAELHGLRDVVFVDADEDTDLELVVLAELMTGVGPQGAVPFVEAVAFDIGTAGVSVLPLPALAAVSRASEVYAALRQELPPEVAAREAALQCSRASDCSDTPSAAPWAPHVLALARSGNLDLPWTPSAARQLLGPPAVEGSSWRWHGPAVWYVVEHAGERLENPRWIADDGELH